MTSPGESRRDRPHLSQTLMRSIREVHFQKYKNILTLKNPFTWVINPDYERPQFSESLIELRNDIGITQMFQTTAVTEFWANVKKENPVLWHEAKHALLPFPTLNMCGKLVFLSSQ